MRKEYVINSVFAFLLAGVLVLNFAFADPYPSNSFAGIPPTFNVKFVHSSDSWSEAVDNEDKLYIASETLAWKPTPSLVEWNEFVLPNDMNLVANVLLSWLPASITSPSSFNTWHVEMCDYEFHRVALPEMSQIYDAGIDDFRDSQGYVTRGDESDPPDLCDNLTITLAGEIPDYTNDDLYPDEVAAQDWGYYKGYDHSQFNHELAHTCWLSHVAAWGNIIVSNECKYPLNGTPWPPSNGVVKQGDALDQIQAIYFQTYTLGLQYTPGPGTPTPFPYPGGYLWPTPWCATPTPTQ